MENMAASSAPVAATRWGLAPPWIGLLALVVAFIGTPLSHSLSVAAYRVLGRDQAHLLLLPLGMLALVLLWIAVRSRRESTATLLGYLSALLVWVGWAAYAFKFNEISLAMPMAMIEGSPRPMNLLFIQGSVGICLAMLVYFAFDKDSHCNAFRWLQRHLHLGLGKTEGSLERNYGRITFMETLTVLWFCYAASLFMGDARFLGYHHPGTYALVAALLLWGGYLLYRLFHFTRIMAAIRYAIPTKAILWIPLGEFFPRWGFYEEIWLEPWNYTGEVALTLLLFVGLGALSIWIPQRRIKNI